MSQNIKFEDALDRLALLQTQILSAHAEWALLQQAALSSDTQAASSTVSSDSPALSSSNITSVSNKSITQNNQQGKSIWLWAAAALAGFVVLNHFPESNESSLEHQRLEGGIINVKAALIRLGYLNPEGLNGEWTLKTNDAFYYLQKDFYISLQDPAKPAHQEYGNIRDQQSAVFGSSYNSDPKNWKIENIDALTTIVGQVTCSAWPDLRQDLTSNNEQSIKIAQSVINLCVPIANLEITGIVDDKTIKFYQEYLKQAYLGVPFYILNGRNNPQIDWSQAEAAAERGNLPMPLQDLPKVDRENFLSLGGHHAIEARKYYVSRLYSYGENFYGQILINEAKRRVRPLTLEEVKSQMPQTSSSIPTTIPSGKIVDSLNEGAANANIPSPLEKLALSPYFPARWYNSMGFLTPGIAYNNKKQAFIAYHSNSNMATENAYAYCQEETDDDSCTMEPAIVERTEAYCFGVYFYKTNKKNPVYTTEIAPHLPSYTPEEIYDLTTAFCRRSGRGLCISEIEITCNVDQYHKRFQLNFRR